MPLGKSFNFVALKGTLGCIGTQAQWDMTLVGLKLEFYLLIPTHYYYLNIVFQIEQFPFVNSFNFHLRENTNISREISTVIPTTDQKVLQSTTTKFIITQSTCYLQVRNEIYTFQVRNEILTKRITLNHHQARRLTLNPHHRRLTLSPHLTLRKIAI